MTGGGTVPVSGWVVGATVGLAIVAGTALWLHRRRTDAPRRAAARSVLGVGIIPWLALTLVVTLTPDPVSYARRIVVMAPTDFGQGAHRSPPAHARPHPDRAELFALRPLRHPRSGSMASAAASHPPHPGRGVDLRGIEGMQFSLAVGRTTSADDVLANTLVALLGWVAAAAFGAAWRCRSWP